ncbi:MAG: hypothetical protein LBM96_05815 [Methanobrevibacter sp.]|jgi:hypothetical protein|nr:hypothetical protein [Candidatus Methanoflexus mossambicus]
MNKVASFKVKGMNRDLSESAYNPEFAYEINNMRFITNSDNTMYSLVNEKGTLLTTITISNVANDSLIGIPIGLQEIDNKIVIFTCHGNNNNYDRIYLLWFDDNNILNGKLLYSGSLNFSIDYPIECVTAIENDEIKKVYFTDGLNQPRVINIAATNDQIGNFSDTSFDIAPTLKLQEEISIEKINTSGGNFQNGVIQYFFSYINYYDKESKIFYQSPLYYTSMDNRGGSPEEISSNSFKITLNNLDTQFDYIRIYSVFRTSENTTPSAKKIIDLATSDLEISYIDNNTQGESVNASDLFFIGSENITAYTFEHKDNVLFLGNITLNSKRVNSNIKNMLDGADIIFNPNLKSLPQSDLGNYYSYETQLNNNSFQIKTFKYLEVYRFGLQFQDANGKFSDPVWLNDVLNNVMPTNNYAVQDVQYLTTANYQMSSDIITELINSGYKKVRPVIVYPEKSDRNCICQGILNPTIYSAKNKRNSTPDNQASWFFRPKLPFDVSNTSTIDLNDSTKNSANSKAGVVNEEIITYNSTNYTIVHFGSRLEFRHSYPLPNNNHRNAEIQCITSTHGTTPPYTTIDKEMFLEIVDNAHYIDESVLTLNSPELEFDEQYSLLNTNGLQLRIIGIIPITAFDSKIDIITSSAPNVIGGTSTLADGFYDYAIHRSNVSRHGYRHLATSACWFDAPAIKSDSVLYAIPLYASFAVYPFHRNGSLNNQASGTRASMLKTKTLLNYQFSYNSYYFDYDNIYNFYEENNGEKTGCNISIFSANEVALQKINKQNNNLSDINYYGNIDNVLTLNGIAFGRSYPIQIGSLSFNTSDETTKDAMYLDGLKQIDFSVISGAKPDEGPTTGTDPIEMKYKSTRHAAIALNLNANNYQKILPTIYDADNNSGTNKTIINNLNLDFNTTTGYYFWDTNKVIQGISQDVLDINIPTTINNSQNGYNQTYGFLYIGEIYNPNVINRFGGTTEEAFEVNNWVVCGDSYSLFDEDNNPLTNVTIRWSEGDTFYQRYDCLKTYPFSKDDQNQIIEILSCMIETRINIDGRYDKNRGQIQNLGISPDNFNLINSVYSQKNNLFNYLYLNENKINLDQFRNTITWTSEKINGSISDAWTNLTFTNILDLDADKGQITSLNRFNNNLFAFQSKALSNILYNEQVQIQPVEGVPIQLMNSGKVQGKRYISDYIGCNNKWSIATSPNGIYFIDDYNKDINLFNGQINNLSAKLGFYSWIQQQSNLNIWSANNFPNFKTIYNKINDEIYFINADYCLTYSELLNTFTSFYHYMGKPYFGTMNNRGLWLQKQTEFPENKDYLYLYLHQEGLYNRIFNYNRPFGIELVVNPDMQKDKIFNILEFRSDSWDSSNNLLQDTFDKLVATNEYQTGTLDLISNPNNVSSLARKFRNWRCYIPRDDSNGFDRIRNNWIHLKLSKEASNNNKTILHDLSVYYFD